MTTWIEAIALWLADFYLAATLLLVCVVAILLVVKQPARRMAVGWGTLVSLLLAAVLCQSSSRPRLDLTRFLQNTNDPVASVVPPSLPVAGGVPKPVVREIADSARIHALPSQTERRPEISLSPFDTEAPHRTEFSCKELSLAAVVCTFLAGTCLMATWLSIGVLRAVLLVRHSRMATGECVDVLKAIVGPAVRSPRLGVHRSLLMPVATGTFRPVILLPESFAQPGRLEEIKAVLAHEWAHIKNGDLWQLALDRVVLTLLWAHPLYWWTRRRLRTDRELLADGAAAAQIGAAEYAELLVAWARHVVGTRHVAVSNSVGIGERRGEFSQRVAVILNQSERMNLRCSGRARAGIVICLASFGILATALSVRSSEPAAKTAPSVSKARAPVTKPPQPKLDVVHVGNDEIRGVCVDQQKLPVRGARLSLYRVNWPEFTQQLIQETSTGERGEFKFSNLTAKRRISDNDVVIARRDGLATSLTQLRPRGKRVDIEMRPAATFRGTIRDGKGKPVAGALVDFGTAELVTCLPRPIEGVRCARTDQRGEFAVTDLYEFHYARPARTPNWHGAWMTWGPPSMTILHPGYARSRAEYNAIPGKTDVVLSNPAGTIEGQVVFANTGEPAAGVTVAFKCVRTSEIFRDVAQTKRNGRYQVTSLPDGSFSIWVSTSPKNETATVIDTIEVRQGRTTQAPPMRLVKGGAMNGRIVDDVTARHGAGITLHLQGVDNQTGKASSISESAETNGQGEYHFDPLPGGKFNVFLNHPGLGATAAAIASFEVHAGERVTAPPIHLVRGCVIKGRVIDDTTGELVSRGDKEYLDVQIKGPSRPSSGAAVEVADVRKDGTFEIRLPRGDTWMALRVRQDGPFDPTDRIGWSGLVPDGGEIEVEFHVRRISPTRNPVRKTGA